MARLSRAGAAKETIAPDVQRAIACYEQALAIAQAIGDRTARGAISATSENAWLHLGDAARAIDLLDQALVTLRETGRSTQPGLPSRQPGPGHAYQAIGDVPQARQCWSEALAIYESYGNPRAGIVRTWLQRIDDQPPGHLTT